MNQQNIIEGVKFMSKIIYSDYYIPSNTVPAKDILRNSNVFLLVNSSSDINTSVDKYIRSSGINEVAVEKELDLINIFSTLITRMLENNNIVPDKIKNIFYTNYEDYDYNDMVSVPYYLQEKFELCNAAVVILNQNCSSSLQAVRMADALNKKGEYSLILSSSFQKQEVDRYIDLTILGDGAGIILVGDDSNEGLKIIDTFGVSDGSASYYSYGVNPKIKEDKYALLKLKMILFDSFKKAIRKTAANYENWFSESKYIITSNITNIYMDNYVKETSKVYVNCDKGHIGDVDISLNLRKLTDLNKFYKGDKIVLLALGGDIKSTNVTTLFCQYE